jgi:hypothetical protein
LKYQCSNEKCKKSFQHPVKQTVTLTTVNVPLSPENTTDTTIVVSPSTKTETTESYVCPFCGSTNYVEAPDESKQSQRSLEDIIAMVDCLHENANQYLDQGYKVYVIYQKNTVLVKYREDNAAPSQAIQQKNEEIMAQEVNA